MSEYTKGPMISICIPCYNHEKFINDCFESLMNQTYQNIELIINDDGSKDNSWFIIKENEATLKEHFEKVIIRKSDKNLGLTKTLNKLIPLCNGKYVKLLASDDFLDSKYIELMVEYMEKNEDTGVLFCNGICVKEESSYNNPLPIKRFYTEPVRIDDNNVTLQLYNSSFILAPGAMVRKKVYDVCGVYDEKIGIEDWEFWLRVAVSEKFKFDYLDEVLVYYRKNDNSMSSPNGESADERRLKFYNAETQIIKKYAGYVEKEVAAKKMIGHIVYGERLAYKYKLVKNIKQTTEDYNKFSEWKYVPFKNKMICKMRHYLKFLNK